jgi:hypothetical protein
VFGVSCSRAFKGLIVLLLPLTLMWKLANRPDDVGRIQNQIIDFLVLRGFDVALGEEKVDQIPVIHATAGLCRMLVARPSAYGYDRDIIRGLARSDQVFVVFRGTIYPEQPVWLTILDHLWSRILRETGVVGHLTPVIAVIAPTRCEAEKLPWSELRELGVN